MWRNFPTIKIGHRETKGSSDYKIFTVVFKFFKNISDIHFA